MTKTLFIHRREVVDDHWIALIRGPDMAAGLATEIVDHGAEPVKPLHVSRVGARSTALSEYAEDRCTAPANSSLPRDAGATCHKTRP